MIEGILKINSSDNIPAREVETRQRVDKEKRKSAGAAQDEDATGNDRNDMQKAVERIETTARYFNRKIHIEIEKELGIPVVKVVDGETDEVIRQIPSKEVVELSKRSQDLKGLLINKEG